MVVTITLVVDPAAVHYGDPVTFSGNVSEDGVPLDGEWVSIFVGGTQVLGFGADAFGNYAGQWTPDVSWTGVHQVQANLAYDGGYWSPSVALTVTGGVQVRFFLFDEANAVAVEGAVVTLDGVQLYTDAAGLAVFDGATQGTHTFAVDAPGYTLVTGFDVFGDDYGLTGMFNITWKPTGDPYPEDQPWTMEFHLTPSGEPPPPPPTEFPWMLVGFLVVGAGLLYMTGKRNMKFLP